MATASWYPPCVMVVDDDPELLDLLEYRLKTRGYAVMTANDGETALRMIGEIHPHLIVLDAIMPGIDGFEVLRSLKHHLDTARIPVMMLTARKGVADVQLARKLGADDYVAKPFNSESLIGRIDTLLKRTGHGL